jgi:hypothetical protein
MKRLLILALAILLSLTLIGRPKELNPREIDNAISSWVLEGLREMGYTILPEVIIQDTLNRKGEKSNYEKYWESKNGKMEKRNPNPEFDDLYFNAKTDQPRVKRQKRMNTDQIIDTLVKENPNITVNYYELDPFYYSNMIGRYHHYGFNYWMYSNPWYYNSWFYNDFYFGWNYPYFWHNDFYFGYNWYFGWNRYGYNNYNHYNNNYYGNNNFNHNYNNPTTPQYIRRERPSNLTQGNPPSNRRIESTQPQRNRIEPNQQRNSQNMKQYSESRRQYVPTYDNPKMNTRPQFNNSRVSNTENRRTNIDNGNRNIGNTNTIQNRRYEMNNSTQTYSAPPNRSYSEPSRINNSNDFSRRSNESNSSGSGMGRSSSGSSSGSSNSSGNAPTRR